MRKFLWECRSVTDYVGELFIFDKDKDDRCIHIEVVDLPGPPFSPDVSDIYKWERIVDGVIDSYLLDEGDE